jgi:hypothetical protein
MATPSRKKTLSYRILRRLKGPEGVHEKSVMSSEEIRLVYCTDMV